MLAGSGLIDGPAVEFAALGIPLASMPTNWRSEAVHTPGRTAFLQLRWLQKDLEHRAASQPIVLFAHVPLWTVTPEWGWGTDDGAQAIAVLRRFGSVTVLNGHVHQIMQKVEGDVAFHTALSTAFPQPAPGTAPSPGPIKDVPPGKLRSVLGVIRVSHVQGRSAPAVIDTPLGA